MLESSASGRLSCYNLWVNRGFKDWGGLFVWAFVLLVVIFEQTKHLWFDSIGAANKPLFWTTLLGPVVAAIGWYVAANENYRKNRELEVERQDRDHRGILRQVNMLLRVVIKNLRGAFLSLPSTTRTWRIA